MFPLQYSRRPALLGAFLSCLLAALSCSAASEYYVAPAGGSDQASGTQEQPLASPAEALRRARSLRRVSPAQAQGGVSIILLPGIHRLDTPLVLLPADSGTPEAPLHIRSLPGKQAELCAGSALTGWTLLGASPAGARLPAGARAHVWSVACPLDPSEGDAAAPRQLWINGLKATRARLPNAPALEQLLSWDRENETAGMASVRLPELASLRCVELFVLQQWETATLRLASVSREGPLAFFKFRSPEAKIEFEHPWPQPLMPPHGAGAFMLVGAPEFLDTPGEWAYDPLSARLLYWPRDGEDPTSFSAIVPRLENLLLVKGTLDAPVTDVTLTGLVFSHSAWQRPARSGHVPLQAGMYLEAGYSIEPKGTVDSPSLDNQAWLGRPAAAVLLEGVQRFKLERCVFTHTAMSGLDIVRAASQVAVERCTFKDLGGNALQAGSFQDGPVETHIPYNPSDARELCSDLLIKNNYVADAANEDWGCVGIIAGYVRSTEISHNEITDVSYTAISLGWGWTRTLNCMRDNKVHANLLHHIATRMCDTAGVYTLSAQPGTVVSENVVHSIRMSPYVDRPDHWFYLYTDEGSAYLTVRDNWTEAAKYLQNANGPNNLWENNGPQVSEKIRQAAGIEP